MQQEGCVVYEGARSALSVYVSRVASLCCVQIVVLLLAESNTSAVLSATT